MTATAIDILNSIDTLPTAEQHQLVLALLRRISPVEPLGPIKAVNGSSFTSTSKRLL